MASVAVITAETIPLHARTQKARPDEKKNSSRSNLQLYKRNGTSCTYWEVNENEVVFAEHRRFVLSVNGQ